MTDREIADRVRAADEKINTTVRRCREMLVAAENEYSEAVSMASKAGLDVRGRGDYSMDGQPSTHLRDRTGAVQVTRTVPV